MSIRDATADLTQVASHFSQFEVIDMIGNDANTLILDPTAVHAMATADALTVTGTGEDILVLKGTWAASGNPELINGVAYQTYTSTASGQPSISTSITAYGAHSSVFDSECGTRARTIQCTSESAT